MDEHEYLKTIFEFQCEIQILPVMRVHIRFTLIWDLLE